MGNFFGQSNKLRVLLVGFKGAGKLTTLYKMSPSDGAVHPLKETEGVTRVKFLTLEIISFGFEGGNIEQIVNKNKNISGIIFMIDASDRPRISYKCNDHLINMLTFGYLRNSLKENNVSFDINDIDSSYQIWPIEISNVIYEYCKYKSPNNAYKPAMNESALTLRHSTVRKEMEKLLSIKNLNGVPLLILGNKADLAQAANANEIMDILDIADQKPMEGDRNWYMQPCCACTGDGIYEGLDWLQSEIRRNKK